MARLSEFEAKKCLANKQLKAALIIESAGLLEQAAAMHWVALRTFLFSQLTVHGIQYHGTRDAITAIMKLDFSGCHSDLMFAYLIGTMAEWDEGFLINKDQLNNLKLKCENVRQCFHILGKGDWHGI